MGVIKRGILGGFSGKVANVVGTSWKGIAVMKSLPLSVANPNTLAQQTQRIALSEAVACGQDVTIEVIRALNNRWAGQMSGFNSFVSRATPKFKSGNDLAPYVKMFSEGTYVAPEGVDAIIVDVPGMPTKLITLANLTNYAAFASTDKAYLICNNTTANTWETVASGVLMDVTPFGFVPSGEVGDAHDYYLSIVKADGTIVSDCIGVRF
jgi:hypothetical protein